MYAVLTLLCLAKAINPLLDADPVDVQNILEGDMSERMASLKSLSALAKTGTMIVILFAYKTEYKISVCRSFSGCRHTRILRARICTSL